MFKHRKLIISILAAILALLMIVPTLISVFSMTAGAAHSSDYNDDIAALQDRIKEMQGKINGLNAEADEIQARKDDLDADINANKTESRSVAEQKIQLDKEAELLYLDMQNVQAQVQQYIQLIALKQQEVDAAVAEEERQIGEFKIRIRAMEENGEISYLSVLFQARSFSDLLDRLSVIEELAESEQKLITMMKEAREAVAEAQEELEDQKTALDVQRRELEERKAEYDAKREQADQFMLTLNAELYNLDDEYEVTEKEEAALEQDILKFLNGKGELADELKDLEEAKRKLEAEEAAEAERIRQAAIKAAAEAAAAAAASKVSSTSADAQAYSSYSSETVAEGDFSYPLPSGVAQVTSPFGYRVHPITGNYSMHKGVDLSAPSGTNIYASKSGTVIVSTYSYVYGNYVVIAHGSGQSTLYAHMVSTAVSEGAYVVQGQTIGYVGTTGWSTGNHLHFEVIIDGEYNNPMSYVTLR